MAVKKKNQTFTLVISLTHCVMDVFLFSEVLITDLFDSLFLRITDFWGVDDAGLCFRKLLF